MITQHLRTIGSSLYDKALQPRSEGVDERRHEFILNVLLGGLLLVAFLALVVTLGELLTDQNTNGAQSVIETAVFLAVLAGCRWAVRRGYARVVSYGLLAIITLSTTRLMLHWSFELPQVLLVYAMVIVAAGVLLGARAGRFATLLVIALITFGAFAQAHHYLQVNIQWRQHEPVVSDAIGYALVFFIIGVISWLSNREIDGALQRARRSERTLLKERDNLEVKVTERTKELERLQLLRIMELERFATFGKISAGLMHEVANPLMAATLTLQQMKIADKNQVALVHKNLWQIERSLETARRQLRGGSLLTVFSAGHELRQVARVVRPAVQRCRAELDLPDEVDIKLRGDPSKFSQIMTNLLVNAMESYPAATPPARRIVKLTARRLKRGVELVVHDRGGGITPDEMEHIFEPFYSKKPHPGQHEAMGIGLGIVKRFVEDDFHGNVHVTSSPETGTRFMVTLYSTAKQKAKPA